MSGEEQGEAAEPPQAAAAAEQKPDEAGGQKKEDAAEDGAAKEEDAPNTDDDRAEEAVTNEVTNIFHGQVLVADGGTVGFSVGDDVLRDSGRIAEAEILSLQKLFYRPPAFDQALVSLRRKHLLILVGEEGSGRCAGSIMLAHELRSPKTPITRFPPTRTLADLGRQKFKRGQCYVLRDWIPTATGVVALTAYDAEHLAARLDDAGAYLVVTALVGGRAGTATAAFEERWTAPDPVEVFDYCFERVDKLDDVHEALPRLRERAAHLGSARRVVHLARQLCDGADHALLAVDDKVQRDVDTWFEDKPTRRAIRTAAVLAFACRADDEAPDAPGVGQRGFEHLFGRLEEAEAVYRGDQEPEAAERPDEAEAFPLERSNLLIDTKLAPFTVEPPVRPVVGVEHKPGFRTAAQRDLFLAGLVRHCGDELWSPVQAWLAEAISRPQITDTHLAIAYGIGRMARYDAKEVQNAYLEHWAAGYMAERYCAVFTLWSMAAEDDLAPLALAQARDWVWGRGAERAMVAAIAFGGALGKRYPNEAVWRLWDLALRGRRISVYARVAIGNLLAIDAAANDPVVARFLAKKIRPLMEQGTNTRLRRTALSVVLAALSVPGSDGKTPAILTVLRRSPAARAPVGELWSSLIRSTPHRPGAITVLHRTLKALEHASNGAEVAAGLGRQILPALSRAHRTQVELGLRKLATPEEWRRAQAVLAAFLAPHDSDRSAE